MTAYLTATQARSLGTNLPGLTPLWSLNDTTLDATLVLATMDIDALTFQGRKLLSAQELAFPRVPYGVPLDRLYDGGPTDPVDPLMQGGLVWDWDAVNNVAVVPPEVLMAVLYQAAWLLNPKYAARLENIRSGLAAQAIGTGSETLQKPGELDSEGLCDRATRYLKRFRLRSGRML